MAGTKEGGAKARAKNLAKDPDFYSKIALKAQAAYMAKPKEERLPRGFAYNPELARKAGKLGGTISRRKKKDA